MANSNDTNESVRKTLFTNRDNVRFEPSSPEVINESRKLSENLLGGHACPKCGKHFSKKSNVTRHEKSAVCDKKTDKRCKTCKREFKYAYELKKHTSQCNAVPEECTLCKKRFMSRKYLDLHMRRSHDNRCPICGENFADNREQLVSHARRHFKEDYLTLPQVKALRKITGKSVLPQRQSSNDSSNAVRASNDLNPGPSPGFAFKQTSRPIHGNAGIQISIVPTGAEKYSLLVIFDGKRQQISWNLEMHLRRWTNVRWYLNVKCRMIRYDKEGDIRDTDFPCFRAKSEILLSSETIPVQVDQAYFKVNLSLESYCSSESGWVLDEVLLLELFVLRYRPLGGNCSDLELPHELLSTNALINVTGRPANSKNCFLYAVLAAIHNKPNEHNGPVHWSAFEDKRRMYRFPDSMDETDTVTLAKISEFEKENSISVNVFAYDDGTVFPLYVSTSDSKRGHANLLLLNVLQQDDTAQQTFPHYCAIKDLGKLIYHQRASNHKLYVCPRCLNAKYSSQDLQKHLEQCNLVDPLNVKMPKLGESYIEFKKHHLQLEAPFVIVARFECFRRPIYDSNEPTEGAIVREKFHDPCAFGYYRISIDNSYPKEPVFFTHSDPCTVMNEFFKCMQREQTEALAIMQRNQPMQYCDEGIRNIEASNDKCHICDDPFLPGQRIAMDHCHITGKIRGRACLGCNLKLRVPNHLVVVMNDLSAYDGRIIMCAAEIYGAGKIRVIPKTIDTYAGLTIDRCRFIDFKSFFKDSLKSLVDGLRAEEGDGAFVHANTYWPHSISQNKLDKIALCRDYIKGPEELTESDLPPIDNFGDCIEETTLSQDEYRVVQRVWDSVNEKSLKKLMELALITDCLFTADIISKLRTAVVKDLRLDPMRFYTLASFAWESALRFSGIKLELQTCNEAHLMIENAIRGGIAVVGNPRYARANNREMPNGTFNEDEETSYIDFLDFNGLYTSTMTSARLPAYGFRFLSRYEIERFDFEQIPEDSDHGFILEVDLSYPPELHDDHDDFPLAPERVTIAKEDLSDFTVRTAESCGVNTDNMTLEDRLCLTLEDKKKYMVHYRNLQFYTKHGLQVTKIHRVLTFVQVPFLQSFMVHCADQRRKAKSPFYKTLWKSIANLVSGKSYENPRHYKDVRICINEQSMLRLVSKPTFDCLRVLTDNLTAVQMYRPVVVLNKPIAVGFTILELSKLTVYSFFYDFVKPKLCKNGRVSFLAGDTDSLVLQISGVPDLKDRYLKYKSMFDFSNLPNEHPLRDDENKMVPGKVKFEQPGQVGMEFVALSPKCYSFKTDQGFKQTRKGCSRELKHDLYKQCLLDSNCHSENVKEVRNYDQKLYQVSVNKRVLSILDYKRFHFDNLTSVSFGHYCIKDAGLESAKKNS